MPLAMRVAEATAKPRIPIGFLGATYSHGPDKIKLAMTSPEWEFVGVHETAEAGRQACDKLGAKLISQAELLQRATGQALTIAPYMRYLRRKYGELYRL